MTTRLDKLKSCNSKPDLARLLGIDPVFMTRVIYIRNTDNLYSQFTIKKRMVVIGTYQPQTLNSKKFKVNFPTYFKIA